MNERILALDVGDARIGIVTVPAQAARQAAQSCSSVALASPHSRFSRMVPENRVFFCRTTLTASRRCSIV